MEYGVKPRPFVAVCATNTLSAVEVVSKCDISVLNGSTLCLFLLFLCFFFSVVMSRSQYEFHWIADAIAWNPLSHRICMHYLFRMQVEDDEFEM
jgi:hypothetical protein